MKIKILDSKDVLEYKRIRLEGMKVNPEAFSSSFEEESVQPISFFSNRIEKSDTSVVVGTFDGNKLIGTAGFFRECRTKLSHKGFIWGVYLSPKYRGQGYSASLFSKLISEIQTFEQLKKIQLNVNSDNSAAKRLYTKFGFKSVATEKDALRVAGKFHDADIMELYLI